MPVSGLGAGTRDQMWRLFASYYDGIARAAFERDLAEKDHVILLEERPARRIRGFSTLRRYAREFEGRRFHVIFSGDTIVDRAFWGQPALQNAFGAYMTRTKLRHPFGRVYWFLISKGYKTYLLLSRNFPDHWPRHGDAMPAWERGVIDLLARERFGDAWRPELGVIRYPTAHDRLREGVATVGPAQLAHADVRFFVYVNPGHARGDELACLGRVGSTLWLRYAWKRVRRRARRQESGRPWSTSSGAS